MDQKKKYKIGFTLGKFMPPHAGHLFMIESALEQTEELIVLLCTVKRESIPGELRYEWMQKLLTNPRIKLVHVTDEVPSYPHEHSDFWSIWENLLKKYLPESTEVFFSSEEYGDEVAKRLKIDHVNIDQGRKNVPISAQAIRKDPYSNWEYIPEPVRSYYVKKIVLTGPESTGKTTLAEKLAQHFNTTCVEEYGREHFVKIGGQLTPEDIDVIARRQVQIEEAKTPSANKFLICDTDLIVTKVWSQIYFGSWPDWLEDEIAKRRYELFLLMDIDVSWIDDGTREFPHLREVHFKLLKEELDKRGLPYKIISGDYEERMQRACEEIEKLWVNG